MFILNIIISYNYIRKVHLCTGKWSADVPRCEKITCPPIDVSDNALLQLLEHNNTYGGRAVFICMWGHRLSGPQNMICEGDGRWNGSIPTCLGIRHYYRIIRLLSHRSRFNLRVTYGSSYKTAHKSS